MIVRLALAAAALAFASAAAAQTAPAEPDVLNNASPEALQFYGLPGGAKPRPRKDEGVQFGKAVRVELPGGMAIVTQCDLSRAVQINDRARAYAFVPFASTPAATSMSAAARAFGLNSRGSRVLSPMRTWYVVDSLAYASA